ncbi:MAG: hypothetical protein AAFS10_13750, partial [Myxococcota bacterium]
MARAQAFVFVFLVVAAGCSDDPIPTQVSLGTSNGTSNTTTDGTSSTVTTDGGTTGGDTTADAGFDVDEDVDEDTDEDVPTVEVCGDDSCDIDGECIPNETVNPDNGCEICLVLVDPVAWTPNDAGTCDDDDACTENDRCEEGLCVGDALECDDGNACTDDICDSTTGECNSVENTGACFDGDPCTVGDVCSGGSCIGGGESLDCDDGNPCTADRCEAGVGCVSEPMDGVACDDGNPCTMGDSCQAGACVAGDEEMSCDDEDLCTVDSCDPVEGCIYTSVADLCADDNPCTDETCDPEQGCVYPFNTNPCNDMNACTEGDVCTNGACLGTPVPLNDGNVCTELTCDPAVGVTVDFNTLPCDDTNACTLGDTCGAGMCVPGDSEPDCDDDNLCTDDACDTGQGCTNTPNTLPCNDNNVCTIGDTCAEGGCAPGRERLDCDDDNACTTDSCDPVDGCRHERVLSFGCRPTIVVDFPPRAATLEAETDQVGIRGSVVSEAGAITSFTINGTDVAVDPDTGAFSLDYTAFWGANTLVFTAEDELGTVRKRVQGFHLGRDYRRSTAASPTAGAVERGLAIWLDQETLDDGDDPPPTDLAAIFKGVLDGIDISDFFDPDEPVTSAEAIGLTFDIYVRSLDIGDTRVALQATDRGLRLQARLSDVSGRIFIDCRGSGIGCFFAGGDNPGTLTIDSVDISADVVLSVGNNNDIQVVLDNTTTSVSGGDISSDSGYQDFILTLATALFLDIENVLASALDSELSN